MKKILVVEDEVAIREFEVINLKRVGYDTVEAGNGEDALRLYEEQKDFDIALLDISMPGMDGLTLCRELRSRSPSLGIIMLTARTQEIDKVSGLMLGADDYITKPFDLRELLARVQTVLRRCGKADRFLTAGKLKVDVAARTVLANGEPVALSTKEFDLLLYFLQNPNIALYREQI